MARLQRHNRVREIYRRHYEYSRQTTLSPNVIWASSKILAKHRIAHEGGEQVAGPFEDGDRSGCYTAACIRQGHGCSHRPREYAEALFTYHPLKLTLAQRRHDHTRFSPVTASHLPSTPGLRTVSFTSTLQALCAHLPTCVDQRFGEG
jgi:hypothetical protein